MPVANIRSDWVAGDLVFSDKATQTAIFTIKADGTVVVGTSTFSSAELAVLDGVTAGTAIASKAVVADANIDVTGLRHFTLSGNLRFSVAAPAGAGTNQGNATALTADLNGVTGADGTVGVKLPVGVAGDVIAVINTNATSVLKVYPDTGGAINGGSANASVSVGPGRAGRFVCTAALTWVVEGTALQTPTNAAVNLLLQGVAAGYKVARSAAPVAVTGTSDITTGLATVLAAVACPEDDLDGTNLAAVQAVVTGGAGHILLKAWKVTDSTHPALIAANSAKNISWIAIGT